MHCTREPSSTNERCRSSHDAGCVKVQTVRISSTKPIPGSLNKAEFRAHIALVSLPRRAHDRDSMTLARPLSDGHFQNWRLAFFVIEVGKTLIRGGPLQSAASLAGLPKHDLLDLFRQFEILVRDPLGGMVLEADFDPSVRGGEIRMVPSGLGQMTYRVDHHKRAFPARRPIRAANPTSFIDPARQFSFEARPDLGFAIGFFLGNFAHCQNPILAGVAPFLRMHGHSNMNYAKTRNPEFSGCLFTASGQLSL